MVEYQDTSMNYVKELNKIDDTPRLGRRLSK
jgi:hypothetical protein